MKSLATCLKSIGLDKHEAAILLGARDGLLAENYSAHDSAVMAVQQHLDELLAERADLVKQILEQKPKRVEAAAEAPKAESAIAESIDAAGINRLLKKSAITADSVKRSFYADDGYITAIKFDEKASPEEAKEKISLAYRIAVDVASKVDSHAIVLRRNGSIIWTVAGKRGFKDGSDLPRGVVRHEYVTQDAEAVPEQKPSKQYRYALVNRPASMGAVPKVQFTVEPRPPAGSPHHDLARHGIMVTDRKLTDQEVESFELAVIADEEAENKLADDVAKQFGEYAEQWIEDQKDDPMGFVAAVGQSVGKVTGKVRHSIGDMEKFANAVLRRLKEAQKPAEPAEKPEQEPKTALQVIREMGKSRPFDDVKAIHDEVDAEVKRQTGKRLSEHQEISRSFMQDDVYQAIHDGQYEGMRAYASSLPVSISESAIPTDLSNRAFSGTSMSPEKRGASQRRSFVREMVGLWRRFEKQYNAAPDDRKESFVTAFAEVVDRYSSMVRAFLSSHGRVMSTMIAGPSKFPVERQRKLSDAADKKAQEADEYLRKSQVRLLLALRGANDNSVSAAITEAETKLAERQAAQLRMKMVNAAHAKFVKDSASLDASTLTDGEKRLIREYKPQYSWEPHPFAPYELTNNGSEIRRLTARVEELKKRAADAESIEEPAAEDQTDKSSPVRMVRNAAAGRLQLFFDGKPSDEIRSELKSSGFRWSPSNGAWQRQLTDNAVYSAEQFIAKHFPPADDAIRYNVASSLAPSPSDSAVYQMAQEGKTASEILSFLAKASRRPFNRVLANALLRLGISPAVKVGMPFVPRAVSLEVDRGNSSFPEKQTERNNVSATGSGNILEQHTLLRHIDDLLNAPSNTSMFVDASNGVNGNASPEKRRFNRMRLDAELLRNIIEKQTFIEQGFSGLDVESKRAVSAAVLRSSKNQKVLDSVIKLIPVDVVNMLGSKKLSAKMILHNPAMLASAVSENLGFDVPMMRDVSRALVRSFALGTAIEGSGSALSDVHRLSLYEGSARGAFDSYHGIDYTRLYDNNGRTKYSAAYLSKTNTVLLLSPKKAEADVLHEFVHAATLKAIAAGGASAMRMTALFKHVEKSGKLEGMYGMSTIDEFVAEVFSNPKFRVALESVPAPAGSTLKTAWDWFVRIVARILGFQANGPHTALDRALRDGVALMDENAAIRAADDAVRFNAADDLPPTITVDGVERQTTNSNGKQIHPTEEGVRNFYAWFKNSAVVDEIGRPLVVYHGAKKDISKFEPSGDRNTSAFKDAQGFYFTNDWGDASAYAAPNKRNKNPGNVMPVYLRIENPLMTGSISANKFHPAYISPAKLDELKTKGHDGAIYNDGEEIVVFSPNQIKSATGNTGAFSPDDPDIRYNIAANPLPSVHPAPGNKWQAAKAKAAAILSPENRDKLIYELQDKFIDLRRIRDQIKAIGGAITDLNDAYMGEELYHKRLAHRTKQFLENEQKPLLEEMRAKGVTIKDLETFLHARHAPEANAEMARRNPNQAMIDAGIKAAEANVNRLELSLQQARTTGFAFAPFEKALNEARGVLAEWNSAQAFRGTEAERLSLSGMSNADARSIMHGMTPARRADMDSLAAKIDAINESTLQLLSKYGLMSQESLDAWRNTYKHYVPLHRDEAHPDSVSHPIGQGFSTRGDAAKRRTGSNAEVTNILGHIMMQREAALTRGEKNLVMQRLYRLARQNPIDEVWSVGKVPMIDTIDKKTGFVRTSPDPTYKNKPNVLVLRIAGKDTAIVINEHNPQAMRMALALKNLDVDDLHYLIPIVGKATRWFASINTQYNPIFGVINLMRDLQTGALNLSTTQIAGKQGQVLKDSLSILKAAVKNGGRMPTTGPWALLSEELNMTGGMTGYRDLFLTAEDRSKSILNEMKALDRGNASKAFHAVASWLSDYNEAMETAVRLAAYKAGKDSGMTKERAASLAKNLTVNFNRRGRQTRELGALYAFFNAAVQGTARMAETLSGPAGRKIMAGGVLAGAVSAMLGIAAMGGGDGDDDEWSKIPDFVKERSLIIPIGKDDYIAIPMPLGFHFLPNIGRLIVEMAVYKDKTAGKQLASLFTVLADAFNPLGGSSPPMQIMAPTVLDPFVALAQNKDWTGKPIFIENRSNLDPIPGGQRAKDSATPWAKAFADIVNAATGGTEYVPGGWSPTPDQIDFVIGQLTGGVGREIGKVAATASAPFTGEELPAHKIPLLGRLYGSTAGASGQSASFYENIIKSNEVQNEIQGRRKDGTLAEYLRDNPTAGALAARGDVAERQIRALRKMRDATADVEKSKAINERMANIMRSFNRDAERML